MRLRIRKLLGNFYFIHFEVALGLFAFLGFMTTDINILLFFTTLSFAGSVCGAFIRVIDAVKDSGTKF